MSEIKLNRWCLISKSGLYGAPFIKRAFATKEAALEALEISADACRAQQRKFKDPNACVVEKVGDDAYLWMVKFAEEAPWDYTWIWVGDRADFEDQMLPRHVQDDIFRNTRHLISW